jgi:hypothetical protein
MPTKRRKGNQTANRGRGRVGQPDAIPTRGTDRLDGTELQVFAREVVSFSQASHHLRPDLFGIVKRPRHFTVNVVV